MTSLEWRTDFLKMHPGDWDQSLNTIMSAKLESVVTVRTDREDQTFQGQITLLDKKQRQIKIENDEEYSWILLDDIVDISLIEEPVQ
ncbi:hypothetical protein SK3146_01195 [Paenibacillus konkukensis]|uniref:YolD-like protein n=2 Tax=Paenibacillus TaxID=44249 RepID=A0ABY4RIN8_9BACL|nr:hypothetical protein SK3146_01195 [Paenibacillus konkukensis]